ncbi:MAG: lipoprotein-releasing ABC transporter ATP-binding protein LolD [Gammaproteobacteria bacterium]|jgi:lipoprotein-releasing system ATP-binding protein
MSNIVLRAENIVQQFDEAGHILEILGGVSLSVKSGERVAIVGKSGSGKSTLMHLLGGLDKPVSGEVFINDKPIYTLSEKNRCLLRNQSLGFVYQFHHLLPEFTAIENVAMPLLIRKESFKIAMKEAEIILKQMGLGERLDHKPAQLSGGERQRTAIARALVTRPSCVLADEPTGNLDTQTAQKIFELMQSLNKELNISFVVVTHDENYAKSMDRILRLENGQLKEI